MFSYGVSGKLPLQPTGSDGNNVGELAGKLCGYQGWFSCPGDGFGGNWGAGPTAVIWVPANYHTDPWPDTKEYAPSDLGLYNVVVTVQNRGDLQERRDFRAGGRRRLRSICGIDESLTGRRRPSAQAPLMPMQTAGLSAFGASGQYSDGTINWNSGSDSPYSPDSSDSRPSPLVPLSPLQYDPLVHNFPLHCVLVIGRQEPSTPT